MRVILPAPVQKYYNYVRLEILIYSYIFTILYYYSHIILYCIYCYIVRFV